MIYVADDSDPNDVVLRLSGSYCYENKEDNGKEYIQGGGNFGTCYTEQKTLEITDLPTDYIQLQSGLGDAAFNYCILVPVIQGDACLAVIEIASLEKLPQYKIEFSEKISGSFSAVLAISKANENTTNLLEYQQVKAEELRVQEEESKQNLEEIGATQDEMNRQIEEAQKRKLNWLRKKSLLIHYWKQQKRKFILKTKRGDLLK